MSKHQSNSKIGPHLWTWYWGSLGRQCITSSHKLPLSDRIDLNKMSMFPASYVEIVYIQSYRSTIYFGMKYNNEI